MASQYIPTTVLFKMLWAYLTYPGYLADLAYPGYPGPFAELSVGCCSQLSLRLLLMRAARTDVLGGTLILFVGGFSAWITSIEYP